MPFARLSQCVGGMVRRFGAVPAVVAALWLVAAPPAASGRDDLRGNVLVLIKQDGFGRELAYLKNGNGVAVVVVITAIHSNQPDKPVERRYRVPAPERVAHVGQGEPHGGGLSGRERLGLLQAVAEPAPHYCPPDELL